MNICGYKSIWMWKRRRRRWKKGRAVMKTVVFWGGSTEIPFFSSSLYKFLMKSPLQLFYCTLIFWEYLKRKKPFLNFSETFVKLIDFEVFTRGNFLETCSLLGVNLLTLKFKQKKNYFDSKLLHYATFKFHLRILGEEIEFEREKI